LEKLVWDKGGWGNWLTSEKASSIMTSIDESNLLLSHRQSRKAARTIMKKNPVLVAARCYKVWQALRRYGDVFPIRDASRQFRLVLQPQRFTERSMLRFIDEKLEIKRLDEDLSEIQVKRNGLTFYWSGRIAAGLAAAVLQELDPENAHYYTSPPVQLTPQSVVLDVGACEGLFALRVTKAEQAAKVICFEPVAKTAALLRRAAERNGVGDRIEVNICPVGLSSRDVFFTNLPVAEANHVVEEGGAGASQIRQVSLDDYCWEHRIKLKPVDLIKVDAEGADVDVIKGAERCIREGSPQIAVTTYHDPGHAVRLMDFLRSVQPDYELRLKGFSLWGSRDIPRPLLLQAALPRSSQHGNPR
jgi:FkbM family methyltransferase